MAARVFALIIGIDSYKSGSIWNLHSCVEDAKQIKHWLTNDLGVPRDQIRLQLDSWATKRGIEDGFMHHLTNNPAIERGDAMIIYFAGHGSTIPAPTGWFQGEGDAALGNVEVLCPYDHDTNQPEGRVSGISDRSMHALIHELSQVKGNNITFIADCCFSPRQTYTSVRDRCRTRWTPTLKATPDDLYASLWPGARGRPQAKGLGFYDVNQTSHIFMAACGPGDRALEGKDGGRFTSTLLQVASDVSLHRTTYSHLLDHLLRTLAGTQAPFCLGQYKTRIIFDAVPFIPNARFIPVRLDNDSRLRIEVGEIQGAVAGSELSLHVHNYRGSRNPPITTVVVTEVHPTWCLGRFKFQGEIIPQTCWAQITRWNNRRPFRVHLKATVASLLRRWKLRKIPDKACDSPSEGGLNILRVKNAAQADISLSIGFRNLMVERHDDVIVGNCRRVVKIERKDELDVIDDAARFHLHLHRRNPEYPLQHMVKMELFRLEPSSWSKVGDNLLENGRANIIYERGAIFAVIIRNNSDMDLWPYLFYMDPNCYGITNLYFPESSFTSPPLPKRAHLEIGSGKPGSEALSFSLSDSARLDSGFLKLFLAPVPLPMGVIEQGPSVTSLPFGDLGKLPVCQVTDYVWDTVFASVQFLRE